MLYRLRGRIVGKPPLHCYLALEFPTGEVVLDITVPLTTHERLAEVGQEQVLYIVPYVSEREVVLYGFLDERDRHLFQVLVSLPNVNRGLALRLLSHMRAEDLVQAVAREDRAVFQAVPGIGRKRAERLVFELKQRLSELPAPAEAAQPQLAELMQQALRALVQLGLKESEARERLERVRPHLPEEITLEDLLRRVLQDSGA